MSARRANASGLLELASEPLNLVLDSAVFRASAGALLPFLFGFHSPVVPSSLVELVQEDITQEWAQHPSPVGYHCTSCGIANFSRYPAARNARIICPTPPSATRLWYRFHEPAMRNVVEASHNVTLNCPGDSL